MMLAPSTEQLSIAESARGFLTAEAPMRAVRQQWVGTRSIDDTMWQQCADMGWLALAVPEKSGGLGLGLAEEVMLFREIGRSALPGPFRSTALAASLAFSAGELAIAAEIISGRRRVGLQVGDRAIDAHPGDLLLEATDRDARICEIADLVPVAATDPAIRLANVVPGRVVAAVKGGDLLARSRVLAAAELLGVIEAVRDTSSKYARLRTQFGRPIGSYQAVKHRCADMAIAAYAVQAQVYGAAVYVSAGHPDAEFHAAAAHVLASRSAYRSAADNIQNHGGIGFTWEHDAHVYLKRVVTLEHSCGNRSAAYARLIEPERHEFR